MPFQHFGNCIKSPFVYGNDTKSSFVYGISGKIYSLLGYFQKKRIKAVQKRNNCAVTTVQQVHNRRCFAVSVHNRSFFTKAVSGLADQLTSRPAAVARLQRMESIFQFRSCYARKKII